MSRKINFILIFTIIFSLILTIQYSILAQTKTKQESPKAMIQQLQREIEELRNKINKDPSSPEVGEMKSKIQWNMRKINELAPGMEKQSEPIIKGKENAKSGLEQYMAIIQNNLFMPLGSGGEAEREEFILTGTMGKSAIIQMADSGQSFYVAEGQSFGNNVSLVRVGENSVTIIHEGNRKELKLTNGVFAGQPEGKMGMETGQRSGNFGKDGGKMETANRMEKKPGSGGQKEGWTGGEKKGGDNDWAGNMSIDELRGVKGKIAEHIEGLRAKGVTDPKEYQGAMEKMETVDRAIAEKEGF